MFVEFVGEEGGSGLLCALPVGMAARKIGAKSETDGLLKLFADRGRLIAQNFGSDHAAPNCSVFFRQRAQNPTFEGRRERLNLMDPKSCMSLSQTTNQGFLGVQKIRMTTLKLPRHRNGTNTTGTLRNCKTESNGVGERLRSTVS